MLNRRFLFSCLYMILLISPCFMEDRKEELNGVWCDQFAYDYAIRNPTEKKYFVNSSIHIELDSVGVGSYWDGNIFEIDSVQKTTGETYILKCSKDKKYVGEVLIELIDDDKIKISYLSGFSITGDIYNTPWYRISGPAKIPIQDGKINDTRVRLRTKPDLMGDIWGYLDVGDGLKIIDKTNKKEKIGDMEAYWYKVQTEGYPDGWVYGAYVTIE